LSYVIAYNMSDPDKLNWPEKQPVSEVRESGPLKIDPALANVLSGVRAHVERSGYTPTNIYRVEYQNGVVIFKWVSTKKNDKGETEYYFSMSYDAPGNTAIAPERKLIVDYVLVGTEKEVAENVCYNPNVSPIYETKFPAEKLIADARTEIDAGNVRTKFPIAKLNAMEDAMDEVLEKISPPQRPDFIKGIVALSHLYDTDEKLREVSDMMIQLVTQDLSSQEYPSVFWTSLMYLSPYIAETEDISRIGKMLIDKNLWRMGTAYFVEAYLRGTMVQVEDSFSYPRVMHQYGGSLYVFGPIVDVMLKDVTQEQRKEFLSKMSHDSRISSLESLVAVARMNGLETEGTNEEVLHRYQEALIAEEHQNAKLNEIENDSELYRWARGQFGWSNAYISKIFNLSDPQRPVLNRDLAIENRNFSGFIDNLTIAGNVRFDNYHGEMPFSTGMRVEGDVVMFASSFKQLSLPDDFVITGKLFLSQFVGVEREEKMNAQLIQECERLGIEYEIVERR
jgi:hypothetical protein